MIMLTAQSDSVSVQKLALRSYFNITKFQITMTITSSLLIKITRNNCTKLTHFILQIRLLQYVMPDILEIVATPKIIVL